MAKFPSALLLLTFTPALHPAVRQVSIMDPNYRMAAYDVTIPSNWKFDGIYVPGTSCLQAPFAVFRAYSPDGLTELRVYPRLDWTWTNLPGGAKHPDCLQLNRELSAPEALRSIMDSLQITYVRDAPILDAYRNARQQQVDQLNAQSASMARMMKLQQPMVQTVGFAAAYGESRNGTFTIESRVQIEVDCTHTPLPVFGRKDAFMETCSSKIRVTRAPKGKLAQIDWDHLGAVENNAWVNRYLRDVMARNAAIGRQRLAELKRAGEIRTLQHQQFMASLQHSTDVSVARANEAADRRHTVASDWVDYALDQQTVTGPGGTVHVTSQFSHIWSDGRGEYYGTNDPNTDPNGTLPGNWSQQQKVHGDGTPY